jgi:pterin-4a-carbinolamine dehydratase
MKTILISFFLCISLLGLTQQNSLDSLKKAIILHKSKDTTLAKMLYDYSNNIEQINADSALPYLTEEINLAKELNWKIGLVKGMLLLAHIQYQGNKLDEAVATSFEALKISEEMHNQLLIANSNAQLSESYRLIGDEKNAEFYAKKYLELARISKNDTIVLKAMVMLSQLYSQFGRWDEAEKIWPEALQLSGLQNDEISKVRLLETMGERQVELNNFTGALKYYKQVLEVWEKRKNYAAIAWIRCNLCDIYSALRNKDSASYYGFSALTVAQNHSLKKETMNAYSALTNFFYEFKDYKQALDFYVKFDSIYKATYTMEAARNAEKSRLELEQEKKDAISKTDQLKKDAATQHTKNILYSAIGLFILLAGFLFFNNRQKQKAKTKIEAAYTQLKSTQAQLIQSEKMASLGELTAGIAHEIQNPLNFINNFSEVNKEMIDELQTELKSGNVDEAITISNDIKDNSEKINHHGKRADSIVKGMLQHSFYYSISTLAVMIYFFQVFGNII